MQQQQHTHNGLSYPAMLILASLEQGPRHALALCETIEGAEGLFIEPGTLYRALASLERQGQIEVLDADTPQGPLRLYRITASGRLAIERASARQPHKPSCGRASSRVARKGDHHAPGYLDAPSLPTSLA